MAPRIYLRIPRRDQSSTSAASRIKVTGPVLKGCCASPGRRQAVMNIRDQSQPGMPLASVG